MKELVFTYTTGKLPLFVMQIIKKYLTLKNNALYYIYTQNKHYIYPNIRLFYATSDAQNNTHSPLHAKQNRTVWKYQIRVI